MKTIKFIITLFFLLISYWITYLIFNRNFAQTSMEFAVDNQNENTLMILLVSTILSMVGIFLLGILSIFVHFVFIKLIYSNEIKQAAYFYIKNNRNKQYIDKDLIEHRKNVELLNDKQLPFYHRIYKRIKVAI